ncbi:MAG: isoprenyl transferase [Gammaproteobacteria bacterium]|jgi:undecaprenyl diphosphate synthase
MIESEKKPNLPQHIAIIMDGNGRWAAQRGLPRAAGHKAGVKTLRRVVEDCAQRGIGYLTVFAFSSENWQRPRQEVQLLLDLFISSLEEQVDDLHAHGVRLVFIGERSAFPSKLQDAIARSEAKTAGNTGLALNVAANYGGRWDITRACREILAEVLDGRLPPETVDEDVFARHLNLAGLPEPDLFIRTGGERRISNYLLWQLAYSELYFCDALWPDFTPAVLEAALAWYAGRQRRFGRIEEQLNAGQDA